MSSEPLKINLKSVHVPDLNKTKCDEFKPKCSPLNLTIPPISSPVDTVKVEIKTEGIFTTMEARETVIKSDEANGAEFFDQGKMENSSGVFNSTGLTESKSPGGFLEKSCLDNHDELDSTAEEGGLPKLLPSNEDSSSIVPEIMELKTEDMSEEISG